MLEHEEKQWSDFLDIRLKQYADTDVYPFHMPGHKRQPLPAVNPYTVDITEIEGFDNLHHAQEILEQAQMRAAELYHSKQTFYLVNGSSCGILAALSGAVSFGKKVLFARNSHKAAYHAVFLRHLEPVYLYPPVTDSGVQGAILPSQVEAALEEQPDIQAVFLTSPTYDGMVSDIQSIARIAHAHGIPLIVDEAHGAHFGFHPDFPQSAVQLGADLVIQSVHKTLPSFTQTALLHLNSKLVQKETVQQYLGIFESSSPSYLLMGGIEQCMRLLKEKKEELFAAYVENLEWFYQSVKDLKHLHVFQKEEARQQKEKGQLYDWDFGKILIFIGDSSKNGEQVYETLLEEFHLQMEMCTGSYVTAITSICDTREGFVRLSDALHQIDAGLTACENQVQQSFIQELYRPREQVLPLYEAQEQSLNRQISLEQAEGEISAEFVYLYPPGIPLVTPGERIDRFLVDGILKCKEMGLKVEGMQDQSGEQICVVSR
ncbi:MAG: aminotransferase class I/II-fold pyridoxal phosphate-dependent enzyme [Lachnospiraceae bacterium]